MFIEESCRLSVKIAQERRHIATGGRTGQMELLKPSGDPAQARNVGHKVSGFEACLATF